MSNLFSQVLNMSMTGSVVILLVMLARLILKRAPKIFSYALWSVVLFRLLCPVAFTAPVSVLNALEPEVQEASESTSVIYFIPAEVSQDPDFTFVPAENQSGTDSVQAGESEHTHLDLMMVASYVWIVGSGIMILYSVIQYIRLRLKLVGAMAYRGNVYRADYIDTPFVMGIFSPKIYLPSDVPMNERKYIIAHERHHIRRCDHIIKLLAYFALCIHWFNPLVWAAFILAGKDMEMSCDEAVIRKMGSGIRADYSASLLRLATHKKIIAGMPLAFGEGDTKGRVMNMAKWKKPKLWVSLICLLLCTTILVACAVNPKTADSTESTTTGKVSTSKGLNIRQEPSTTSAVVGNYDDGAMITILEIKDGWGRTDQGWVSLNYVTTMDGTSMVDIAQIEPTVDSAAPTDIENESKALNIREKPDTSSAVVGSYPNGTIVTILETKDGWGKTDQGWIHMDYVTTVDGNTVVDTSDFQPAVDGSVIFADTELVQYGDFYFALPDGMETIEENGVLALTVDAKTVGGIALRHPEQSTSPDAFSEAWQAAMGVPEASDSTMGYIGGGSLYADYETTYFPDMPVNRDDNGNIIQDEIGTYVLENEVTHYFFVNGTDIYDLWFYIHRLPSIMQETVLKSCFIEGVTDLAAMQSALNEEKEALEQCRKVVESVQAGSYHVIFTRSDKNGPVPYETEFLENGEDWLTITASNPITGETEQIAHLYVNGRFFSNQGHLSDAELIWEEVLGAQINGTDGFAKPWLASFLWREDVISYQGTLERDGENSVMLRIDEPFPYGYDSDADYYFVTFTFDSDGRFLDVYIQCNVFMDNAFTETESIVSLDSETVNAEIQKEYQKAIG